MITYICIYIYIYIYIYMCCSQAIPGPVPEWVSGP